MEYSLGKTQNEFYVYIKNKNVIANYADGEIGLLLGIFNGVDNLVPLTKEQAQDYGCEIVEFGKD